MALTRKAKQALANALLGQAGNLVEFRGEMLDDYEDLMDVPTEEIALQLTTWLARLPGESWDNRLPNPTALEEGRKGYGRKE
jgi:hypothetical protein